MATRFYLPSTGAADVTVGASTDWGKATGYTQLKMKTAKISSAMSSKSNTKTAATNPQTVIIMSYVSVPLNAQTISGGTLKGQMRALESNGNANDTIAIAVRLVKRDGTEYASPPKLLTPSASDNTAAAPPEMTTSLYNRAFQDVNESFALSLTSVTATQGDRLVVEIGFRSATATTSYSASVSTGDNSATDLTEQTNITTANNPWVEFTNTISFENIQALQSKASVEQLTSNQQTGTDTSQNITGFTSWEQGGGGTNTVVTSATDQYHSGSRSCKAHTLGGTIYEGVRLDTTAGLTNGVTYTLRGWARFPLNQNWTIASLDGDSYVDDAGHTGTGDWQYIEYAKVLNGTTISYYFTTASYQASIDLWIDDLSLKSPDVDPAGKCSVSGSLTVTSGPALTSIAGTSSGQSAVTGQPHYKNAALKGISAATLTINKAEIKGTWRMTSPAVTGQSTAGTQIHLKNASLKSTVATGTNPAGVLSNPKAEIKGTWRMTSPAIAAHAAIGKAELTGTWKLKGVIAGQGGGTNKVTYKNAALQGTSSPTLTINKAETTGTWKLKSTSAATSTVTGQPHLKNAALKSTVATGTNPAGVLSNPKAEIKGTWRMTSPAIVGQSNVYDAALGEYEALKSTISCQSTCTGKISLKNAALKGTSAGILSNPKAEIKGTWRMTSPAITGQAATTAKATYKYAALKGISAPTLSITKAETTGTWHIKSTVAGQSTVPDAKLSSIINLKGTIAGQSMVSDVNLGTKMKFTGVSAPKLTTPKAELTGTWRMTSPAIAGHSSVTNAKLGIREKFTGIVSSQSAIGKAELTGTWKLKGSVTIIGTVHDAVMGETESLKGTIAGHSSISKAEVTGTWRMTSPAITVHSTATGQLHLKNASLQGTVISALTTPKAEVTGTWKLKSVIAVTSTVLGNFESGNRINIDGSVTGQSNVPDVKMATQYSFSGLSSGHLTVTSSIVETARLQGKISTTSTVSDKLRLKASLRDVIIGISTTGADLTIAGEIRYEYLQGIINAQSSTDTNLGIRYRITGASNGHSNVEDMDIISILNIDGRIDIGSTVYGEYLSIQRNIEGHVFAYQTTSSYINLIRNIEGISEGVSLVYAPELGNDYGEHELHINYVIKTSGIEYKIIEDGVEWMVKEPSVSYLFQED